MLTLLGSLMGFLTSFAPKILDMWGEAADHKREMEIMQMQIEAQRQGHIQRLEEINTQADIAVYQAAHSSDRDTGIKWVEALRGTVRPVITYSFFGLYALVKVAMFFAIDPDVYWADALVQLWTETDMALFAAVISYWFGGRALDKMIHRKGAA